MIYSSTLLFIHYLYNHLHLLIPSFQSIPPPPPSPLSTIKLFSIFVSLFLLHQFSSVTQSILFATPRTAARQASLSITNSQSLFTFRSVKSVMPSNHLILCRPLLLLPSIFPSIRVFSSESVSFCIRWPKYWSFSFSISPFNNYSGQISFTIVWFDLLATQGTLR